MSAVRVTQRPIFQRNPVRSSCETPFSNLPSTSFIESITMRVQYRTKQVKSPSGFSPVRCSSRSAVAVKERVDIDKIEVENTGLDHGVNSIRIIMDNANIKPLAVLYLPLGCADL